MTDYLASRAGTFVPLRLEGRSIAHKAMFVLLGTLVLTASSYISVPIGPVPVTMQTYAIVMIGALAGWRLGAITVLAWLAEAFAGLPVLSGGAGGPLPFIGPTAGYLFAFPFAAALTGFLAERGVTRNIVLAFVIFVAAQALCIAVGAAWLSTLIGVEKAIAFGVTPFLLGTLLKAGLAVATVDVARRSLAKNDRSAS